MASLELLQSLHATQVASIAIFTAMVYDHVTTLDTEIRLIWKARTSLVKVVFLFIRYTSPIVISISVYAISGSAAELSLSFCKIWTIVHVWYQLLVTFLINLTSLLRVYALWNRRPWIAIFLGVVLSAVYISSVVMLAFATTTAMYELLQPNNICLPDFPPLTGYVYPTAAFFEVLVVSLTIYRAIQHKRADVRARVLTVILRDGVVYFGVMLCSRLFSAFLWTLMPESVRLLGVHFAFVVIIMAFSRLLLNLKGVTNHTDWTASTTVQGSGHQVFDAQITIGGTRRAANSRYKQNARSTTVVEDYELRDMGSKP